MRALITGGAGFIGSHLAEGLIAQGHDVRVIDNLSTGKRSNLPSAVAFSEGDITDASLLQPLVAQADAVFHLAAIASVAVCENEPAVAARTNVTGTETVFAAALAQGKPVIYASSAAVYGDNDALPLMETADPRPLGNYGAQKLQNEQLAKTMHAQGLRSVGLRFFNVYGPRQDARSPYSGVISKFMAQAVAGKPLTFFGDGEQTRDFIYVGDIVALLIAAWRAALGCELFNGCTGVQTSLKQLAAAIGQAAGAPVSTEHAPARSGDIRHSLGSPLKAANILNFNARTSLGDGLASLYASEAAHAA